MADIEFTFNANDTTARESVFVYQEKIRGKKKSSVYLRALVSHNSSAPGYHAREAPLARVYLTRIERIEGKKATLVTADTLPLNWALTSGKDVTFHNGYQHYCDLVHFADGQKNFIPMVVGKAPIYWEEELSKPGTYRMHLTLVGIGPMKAVFEFQWPIKKLSGESFSFKTLP